MGGGSVLMLDIAGHYSMHILRVDGGRGYVHNKCRGKNVSKYV